MTDWTEFERRLATALRSVGDRVFLIISAAAVAADYVQFAADGSRLDAETPGKRSAADVDEGLLRAAGWQPPRDGISNMESSLPLPALSAEYRALAERCVFALRDAYGVASPDELVYTAWRDEELPPPGTTVSSDHIGTLDRGDSDLRIPALGLPRQDP